MFPVPNTRVFLYWTLAFHYGDAHASAETTCQYGRLAFQFAIADTGEGIPTDESSVLFSEAETALEHGNGLGLWLVYWTVQASDGELRFRHRDDVDGGGSVVELVLPEAT